MRPVYLFKSEHGIYYVQFSDENAHRRMTARSTRQRSYTEAMKVACSWLQKGLPTREGRTPMETVSTVQSFMSLLEGGKIGKAELERITQSLTLQGYGITATKPVKTLLVSFLENFWTFETSPYVQDKLIHKQKIGKRHCYDSKNRVTYRKEFFTESKYREDVTTEELKAFEKHLSNKKITTGTLNPQARATTGAERVVLKRRVCIRCDFN